MAANMPFFAATEHKDIFEKEELDPQILHGTPVFRSTRVPVKELFESLEAGETVEEFLQGFPGVTREMAIAALDETHEHSLPNPRCGFCSMSA